MKRKIAILLAAIMTTSAISAFAAQTKSPSIEGSTGSAGLNSVIYEMVTTFGDSSGSHYSDYFYLSDLDSLTQNSFSISLIDKVIDDFRDELTAREGVVKIELSSSGSGTISAGDTFRITLENGVFDSDLIGVTNPSVLAYRNVATKANTSGEQGYTLLSVVDDGDGGVVYVASTVDAEGSETESQYYYIDGVTKNTSYINGGTSATTVSELMNNIFKNSDYTLTEDMYEDGSTYSDNSTAQSYIKNMTDNSDPFLPYLPYSIEIIDETTAEITFLTDIKSSDIQRGTAKVASYFSYDSETIDSYKTYTVTEEDETQLYLAIPLGNAVEATNGDTVTATVDGYGNSNVVSGTVTIANVISSGSTYIDTKYIDTKVFEDDFTPSEIIIRENSRDSFNNSATLTFKLSSGYYFGSYSSKSDTAILSNLTDGTEYTYAEIGDYVTVSDTTITFNIKGMVSAGILEDNDDGLFFISGNDKESIKIVLPTVYADDDNTSYGDVKLTFSSNQSTITKETVTIGTRSTAGITISVGSVPTIVKGRYYLRNSSLNTDGNYSAEFEISESVLGTLVNTKNLDITVPSGVKIVDAELVSSSNFYTYDGTNRSSLDLSDSCSITNSGKTLRFVKSKWTTSSSSTAKVKVKLILSVDAAYEDEDITVTVSGGGLTSSVEAVIASTMDPFTISAERKDINIGYQSYDVNDIIITENEAGMFMEGESIEISLSAPYGTSEMGFTNATVTVTSGDLEISPVSGSKYLNSDTGISIYVDSASTEASTITISNVQIGTTRSVPYGTYNLLIGGGAVINNDVLSSDDKTPLNLSYTTLNSELSAALVSEGYADLNVNSDIVNLSDSAEKAKLLLDRFDADSDSYELSDYINVITATTDTISKEVRVTIDSSTILIDNEEVEIDVAPYIQASTGSTMVPLRFVTSFLLGESTSLDEAQESSIISWDSDTKTVTIFVNSGSSQRIIQFQANSSNMIIDGTTVPMANGAVAEIVDSRMFVPFRALGNALGVTVSWDETTRTAIYNPSSSSSSSSATTTTTTTTTTTEEETETTTEETTETTTEDEE